MAKPTATVPGLNHASGALRRAAQERGRAGRDRANALFDQGPARLNRIEVVGVGREEFDGGPRRLDQRPDARGLVRREVVEYHDVAGAQWRTRGRLTQATKGVVA